MYWHRILGTTFKDYYFYSPYNVDLERELQYPQYIDIMILEQESEETESIEQPDGLENLTKYNLITYKSISQTLDNWVIDELVSYYVLLRKIISPNINKLIPVSEFKLIAISTRFPHKLNKEEKLVKVKKGVYKLKRGEHEITVIVTRKTPKTPQNAIWQMFSGYPEQIFEGLSTYKWKRQGYKYVVQKKLIEKYKEEGVKMPYTDKDIHREIFNLIMNEMPIEEILQHVKPEDRLKGLKPKDVFKNYKLEDRLKGLKPEDRLKGLKPKDVFKNYKLEDRLKGLKLEDRLKGLKPEDICKYFSKEELKELIDKI